LAQLAEGFQRNPRLTELHPATSDRIEHPGRNYNDVARLDLNVNEHARGARLTVVTA
jgi:hypothetical protein